MSSWDNQRLATMYPFVPFKIFALILNDLNTITTQNQNTFKKVRTPRLRVLWPQMKMAAGLGGGCRRVSRA